MNINNVNLFILNVRMEAVYFISKSKGAVDPKRLTTTALGGSTKLNYKEIGVLTIHLLYKKFTIMFTVKNLLKNCNIHPKRIRTYDVFVNYTNIYKILANNKLNIEED